MADKNSLDVMGLLLAGVTAGVFIIAGMLVNAHVAGRLVLEQPQSVAELSATRVR
jgi:hypothetical protein